MGDNYAYIKVQKYHTFPQLHGLQQHHNREISLPHVNYEDTIKNEYIVDAGSSYRSAWKNKLDTAEINCGKKINVRQNAVLFFEVVLGYSPEANVDIKKWTKASMDWLNETFGEDNIFACTLHLDEQSPHIHADIIPIDDRNRLCMKSFINGPGDLKKLQTSYGKSMEPFGLARGEKNTKSKKSTLDKFYKAINKIENEKPIEREENESDNDFIERLQDNIKTLRFAYENMKRKAKRTEDIINTRVADHYKDFSDALYLQYTLKDKLQDELEVRKRLALYKSLEETVPDSELTKILALLTDKYNLEAKIKSFDYKDKEEMGIETEDDKQREDMTGLSMLETAQDDETDINIE